MSHNKPIFILLVFLLLGSGLSSVFAQTGNFFIPKYVPRDSSKTLWEIGAGLGVPYGTFGGKYSYGTEKFSGNIGLGILPFSWTPAVSVSGVVHFRDRYESIRPKLTLTLSSMVAAILLLEEGSMEPLYDETFSGLGVYAGADWRLGKTSPFGVDFNIGWVFPFVGNDEIMDRYDEAVGDLVSRGYGITDEEVSLDTVKFSVGVTYSFGRSYIVKY